MAGMARKGAKGRLSRTARYVPSKRHKKIKRARKPEPRDDPPAGPPDPLPPNFVENTYVLNSSVYGPLTFWIEDATYQLKVEQQECQERGRLDGAQPFFVRDRDLKTAAYRWHNQRLMRLASQPDAAPYFTKDRTKDL